MAKHPHRLQLMHKKTWRCVLPGCSWFIHVGLEHILPGKQANCGGCNDSFTLDEYALQDETPKCADCRMQAKGLPSAASLSDVSDVYLALGRAGVKLVSDLSTEKRRSLINMRIVTEAALNRVQSSQEESAEKQKTVDKMTRTQVTPQITQQVIPPSEEVDEIEDEYFHSPDCMSWNGKECDCQ